MKVTIDIDCTPAEARQFLGLPDLQPLQEAWVREIEKKMMASLDQFSPEGLARSWLSGAQVGADLLPAVFGAFMRERNDDKDKKS